MHTALSAFDPRVFLCVAAGAAVGACARAAIAIALTARFGAAAGPLATGFINVSGSLAIGYCVAAIVARAHPLVKWFLVTGVLGGYTTFSSFSLEALAYLQAGRPLLGLAYVAGSVTLGVLGTAVGFVLGRR